MSGSLPSYGDRARVDARDKVLGRAPFAADVMRPGLVHAVTVPARIAKGRVTGIDTEAASRVPGTLHVLTAGDFAGVKASTYLQGGIAGQPGFQPMLDDRVVHRGQPVALAIAETLEAAVEAASLVRVTYAAAPFASGIDALLAEARPPRETEAVGDAAAALAAAPLRIEAAYRHPTNHHNPMELISTTAEVRDGDLFVWEGSQSSGMIKFGLAEALGLDPGRVHVASPYIGGGFGQKGAMQKQTVLAAWAAVLVGRPVKLVMPRDQLFHTAHFRPESRHDLAFGTDRAGKLLAARYSAVHQVSHVDHNRSAFNEPVSRLYAVPAYQGMEGDIVTDTQPTGPMRGPSEHPACWAFESAIDELTYALGQDPVAFRLANDAERDPITGKPFSSRFVAECLREGARRFGWDRRSPAPGSMRAESGDQVGWGVALGAYKAATTPTVGRLRITAGGETRFAVTGHEMGQGIRSAITAALLAELDVDPERVVLDIGDPDAAPQCFTAGSWGTATAVPTAVEAARRMRAALAELRGARTLPGTIHAQLARLRRPSLEVVVERVAPGQGAEALASARLARLAQVGPVYPDFVSFSYIAHFAEVRVEASTRRVRVPRVVSVCDCGRVASPRTAASQVRGGVVWGIGAALREAGEVDDRFGFVVNDDLADYVVPVNADVGDIDVAFIDRPDPSLNAPGVKGLGEVSITGVAAAIGNAVYHATGRRVRHLPIRVEDLLEA